MHSSSPSDGCAWPGLHARQYVAPRKLVGPCCPAGQSVQYAVRFDAVYMPGSQWWQYDAVCVVIGLCLPGGQSAHGAPSAAGKTDYRTESEKM